MFRQWESMSRDELLRLAERLRQERNEANDDALTAQQACAAVVETNIALKQQLRAITMQRDGAWMNQKG